MQEEAERKKYAKFLSQFTMENFLDKVRGQIGSCSIHVPMYYRVVIVVGD